VTKWDPRYSRAQPLGGWSGGPDPPTFETGFFLGGVRFGGSVTLGVWTIIYESLQCTNHHVEPAFRCKIVVDFQYMSRILPRRFVSLIKTVHFLLVTTIRINIGYDVGKKILRSILNLRSLPLFALPRTKKIFWDPQLLDRGCALYIHHKTQ